MIHHADSPAIRIHLRLNAARVLLSHAGQLADLLEQERLKLSKLLDLYLSENFPKEFLIEKRQRLESSIQGLEQEEIRLKSALTKKTFTEKQIMSIQEFAAKVAKGLAIADLDDQVKRQALDDLSVNVVVTIETGQPAVYLHRLAESRVLTYLPRLQLEHDLPTPALLGPSDNAIFLSGDFCANNYLFAVRLEWPAKR